MMIAQVAVLLFGLAGTLGAPSVPVLVPHVARQYHAQDELGQYVYGYSGGPSAKHEEKSLNGVTRGGYSYVDGNGLVQSAAYVSDPVNGFRVAATNLPVGPAVPDKTKVAVAVPAVAVPAPTFALTATPAVAVAHGPTVAVAHAPAVGVAHVPAVAVAHVPAVGVAPAPAGSTAPAVPVQTVDTDNADPSVATSSETEKEANVGAEVLPEVSEEVPEKSEEPVEPEDSEASEAANETNGQAPVSDLPDVSAARKDHLAQVEEVKARNAAQNVLDAQKMAVLHKAPASVSVAGPVPVLTPAAVPVVSSVVAPTTFGTFAPHPPSALVGTVAPVAPAVFTKTVVSTVSSPVVTKSVASGPVVSVVGPAVPFHVASQYHAQDELGQYVYGYSGGPSAKHEEKSFDGTTKGGYSYVDAYGLVQSAAYVSDPHGGFRVLATNLPKQPAPAYIPDSPEVEEAKQKLFKAQAEHVAKLGLAQ